MRWLLAVLVAIPVAGCFDDQKRQIAVCELDAIHTYPSERLDVGGKIEHLIITCMRAQGYAFDMTDKRCPVEFGMATNPYCFVPGGTISRYIFRTEVGSSN
jgi:hypothetical protein